MFVPLAIAVLASACAEGGSNASPDTPAPDGSGSAGGDGGGGGVAGVASESGGTGGDVADAGTNGGGSGGDAWPSTGGVAGSGGAETAPVESRCTATPDRIECPYQSIDFGSRDRRVVWQVPNGTPPASGWPVVLLFHGSIFGAETSFSGDEGEAFSPYNGARNVKSLLDAGFAIIAPQGAGPAGAWDTNFPPYSSAWGLSKDHTLMLELFDAVDAGEFGPMDPERWYAMGISSGGYMTSRVAIEYPGRFVAIAINSGSYMTCTNVLCIVPAQEPSHPPTLFLHGRLDPAVPVITMSSYNTKLTAAGVETKVIIDPDVFHAWLAEGYVEIPEWFDAHR